MLYNVSKLMKKGDKKKFVDACSPLYTSLIYGISHDVYPDSQALSIAIQVLYLT